MYFPDLQEMRIMTPIGLNYKAQKRLRKNIFAGRHFIRLSNLQNLPGSSIRRLL